MGDKAKSPAQIADIAAAYEDVVKSGPGRNIAGMAGLGTSVLIAPLLVGGRELVYGTGFSDPLAEKPSSKINELYAARDVARGTGLLRPPSMSALEELALMDPTVSKRADEASSIPPVSFEMVIDDKALGRSGGGSSGSKPGGKGGSEPEHETGVFPGYTELKEYAAAPGKARIISAMGAINDRARDYDAVFRKRILDRSGLTEDDLRKEVSRLQGKTAEEKTAFLPAMATLALGTLGSLAMFRAAKADAIKGSESFQDLKSYERSLRLSQALSKRPAIENPGFSEEELLALDSLSRRKASEPKKASGSNPVAVSTPGKVSADPSDPALKQLLETV